MPWRRLNVENNRVLALKRKRSAIKDRKQGKLFKLTSAEGKTIKLWGCEVFPKDFKMLAERKLMGSLIQRLETVEVIEFMKEREKKKSSFPTHTRLGKFFKGAYLLTFICSPLKDLLLYIIIHPSYNHLHNDRWGLKYTNVWKRRMTGRNRQTGLRRSSSGVHPSDFPTAEPDRQVAAKAAYQTASCTQIGLNYRSIDHPPGSL